MVDEHMNMNEEIEETRLLELLAKTEREAQKVNEKYGRTWSDPFFRIRPLARFKEHKYRGKIKMEYDIYGAGELYYIKQRYDDFKWFVEASFLFQTEPDQKAEGLEKICTIKTWHRMKTQHQFKPTIQEVVYQIPEKYRDITVAFETSTHGVETSDIFAAFETRTSGVDITGWDDIASTTLYRLK